MRARHRFWALLLGGGLSAGCVAILGDYQVGGATSGDGGGAEAGGSDGGTDATGDVTGEGGPPGFQCAMVGQPRKIEDLGDQEGGALRYEGIAAFHVDDSKTRIVAQTRSGFSGPPPPAHVFTFRPDRPGDRVTNTALPAGAGRLVQSFRHGMRLHLVTEVSDNWIVYALPDALDGSFIDTNSGVTLLAAAVAGANNRRMQVIETGDREYFGVLSYQQNTGVPTFFASIFSASSVIAGSPLQFYTGSNELSVDATSMLRVGQEVFAFMTPGNGPSSGNPLQERKFNIRATDPGQTRDLRTGLFVAGLLPVTAGNVSVAAVDLANPNAPTFMSGRVNEPDLFTFDFNTLNRGVVLNDPDKIPFGSEGSATFYVGPNGHPHLAVVGRGSRAAPPSTGLNLIVLDLDNLTAPEVMVAGTGANLLPGNDRVSQISVDYAPLFGGSYGYDLAWVDTQQNGQNAFDVLMFARIQCDPMR